MKKGDSDIIRFILLIPGKINKQFVQYLTNFAALPFCFLVMFVVNIAFWLLIGWVSGIFQELNTLLYTSFGVGFVTGLAGVIVYYQEKRPDTFGDARFATFQELKASNLHGKNGIVFGKMKDKLIEKPPTVDGHVLICGGSGMGKSKSVAIPTLMRWEGAAICVDIKGELSDVTRSLRPKGKTYVFNPTLQDCAQYNPIENVKDAQGAQQMARVLIPEPQNTNDPFWNRTAQGIFAAALLEGYYRGQTLQQIAHWLMTEKPEDVVKQLSESFYPHVATLAGVGNLPEKTLGSVFGELKSHLLMWATDPGVERSTSRADWTAATLEEGATIYLSVPEHLLTQYRPLWTVIFSQVIEHLSQREEGQNPPILLLMDEFAQLGQIPKFNEALATLRSRNVHMMIFVQSMSQLDEIYGNNGRKIISDNCRYKLILGATDVDTQKYFSELSGQKTAQSVSDDYKRDFSQRRYSEQGVPLLRPEEFGKLKKPILFSFRNYPAEVEQVWYDTDPVLKSAIKGQSREKMSIFGRKKKEKKAVGSEFTL